MELMVDFVYVNSVNEFNLFVSCSRMYPHSFAIVLIGARSSSNQPKFVKQKLSKLLS